MRRIPLQLVCALVFSLVGCAANQQVTETVELEPLVLHQQADQRVRSLEARPLFSRGTEAYSEGRYEDALLSFEEIIRFFSESRYAPHAHFNAGLTLQRLERWGEALGHFEIAAETLTAEDDQRDARFQVVICQEQTERWADLKESVPVLLTGSDWSVRQRLELTVRQGLAHYFLGQLARAERSFEDALEQYRQNSEVPSLRQNVYVSRAQYLIGEIYRGLFESIQFRLPVESMRRDLMDKSSFFLKGTRAYLKCVRLSHRQWAVAAGYRLGRMYEQFFDDMMGAEIPPELDAEDRAVYFEELRSKIRSLVVRAIEVYERNLGMSDRLGTSSEWVELTEKGLERLRTILRSEFEPSRD